MKRFGVVVMEVTEDDPAEKRLFRRHKEEEIFRVVLAEKEFDLKKVIKAILLGGKNGNSISK